MEVIILNKEQVKYLYKNYMVHDFPDDELKPLLMITRGMDNGTYQSLGIIEKNQILGYAIFVKNGKNYLFDYFGSIEKNKGTGTKFLELLSTFFQEDECVVGEVENFEMETNEEDKFLQQRRYNFYLRNGYIDTGVRVKTFGVEYIILELKLKTIHTPDEIKSIYTNHYKSFLPALLYKKNIKVHD